MTEAKREGKRKMQRKENLTGFLFILPGFLGFLIFIFIPVVMSLGISFTEWNFLKGWKGMHFNGLDNYIRLFRDDWFQVSLVNNLIFTAVTIPVLLILGLVAAELINRHTYGGKAVRAMIFIPYIASVVAVCTVWQVLLQPNYGPINQFLMSIGIQNPPKWLVDGKWALVAIMVINVWTQIGYYVAVYMAGLKNIPLDLYEASQIDGADARQQFLFITVPMVAPTTFFLAVMGIIGSFKVFDLISVLTQGGPGNATSVMAY
ncbi:MAG: sugar ABC transporter permease, partial [bacterium]|nr:sugar ABC transporter permease [bacterium]